MPKITAEINPAHSHHYHPGPVAIAPHGGQVRLPGKVAHGELERKLREGIAEGLNALSTRQLEPDRFNGVAVYDYFDAVTDVWTFTWRVQCMWTEPRELRPGWTVQLIGMKRDRKRRSRRR